VPVATPSTVPVVLTVATTILLLLQAPPAVTLAMFVVAFTHTVPVPVIAAGRGLTVIM